MLKYIVFLSCAAALLQQVMSLTAEQVELLPPQQKAQVQALQQQLVSLLYALLHNTTLLMNNATHNGKFPVSSYAAWARSVKKK